MMSGFVPAYRDALEAMRLFPEQDHTDALELPDGFEALIALAVGYRIFYYPYISLFSFSAMEICLFAR